MMTNRCTYRKHVIENESNMCDCRCVLVGKTAAKNATVVTILHTSMIVAYEQGSIPVEVALKV